ncbi:2-Hydroxyacid oxidase 2-like [Amphiura filiformis]|uniref:2-Hydroxyacid oxidase 2-like n=1 Tax=Amphiura filiformis TaxID=82378 RepID=UPI003B21F7F7
MASRVPICVNDFRVFAKERLPKVWFEYQDGGADGEQTVEDNVEAFQRLRLRPRVLRDVSNRDLSTTILGTPINCPIAVAPTAYHQMSHPEGEIATAKAAAGTCMILSSHGSNTHLRDVTAAVSPDSLLWIQLYLYKDRNVTRLMVKMAEKSGYRALVLTLDSPITGKKLKDSPCVYPSLLYRLPNIEAEKSKNVVRNIGFDMSATWSVIDWLDSITTLPIVVKGILTAEDTREALKHNVAGIIVSNHGGRQLDGVYATIDALPEVVEAARGSNVEIYVDGGVRKGTDVLKALALGARAVFIGRPILWGLAYDVSLIVSMSLCMGIHMRWKGASGVKQVLDILKEEFSLAMALTGCRTISDITSDLVISPSKL